MVITSPSSSRLSVTWDSNDNDDDYIVEYQLINTDQCKNEEGRRTQGYTGPLKTFTIPNLLPYSMYRVFVTSVDSNCVSETTMATAVTEESGKMLRGLLSNYRF